MRIGRLNVEITGDSKNLEQAAQRSSDSLKKVKEDIGQANDLSFTKLKTDVGSTTASVQELSRSLSTMTVRALNKEFDSTKSKLDILQAEMAEYQRMVGTSNSSEFSKAAQTQVDKLASSSQVLKNRLAAVKQAMDNLNNAKLSKVTTGIDSVKDSVQSFGSQINKTMHRASVRIRRFIVSLIGLRTAWALLTRATRDYISRDEELNKQTNSMIAALGQALAPMIYLALDGLKVLVQWTIVAIGYFITFINVIFGTNMAISKSIKQMSKFGESIADAKSQLSGFDEINNITTQTDSGVAAEALDFTPYDMTEQLKGLEDFKRVITENKDLILLLLAGIAGVIAALTVMNLLTGLINLGTMLMSPIGLALILIGLIAYIILNWDDVKKWWDANGPVLLGYLKALVDIVLILGGVVAVLAMLWFFGFNLITIAIVAVIAIFVLFGDKIVGVLDWIRDGFNKVINYLQDKFKGGIFEMLAAVLQNWKNSFNAIMDIFKGLVMFISGVFTGNWKKAWEGIKLIIVGVFSGLANLVKGPINLILGMVNTVINGINTMIRGLNSIKFTAPWWVPLIGGKSFGISIPTMSNIPYLASGAIASGPTMAMIGEGRYDEAVVPLGQSPQFASMKQDIADAVADAIGNGSNGQAYRINMYLDDTIVGSVLIDNINRTAKLTGKTVNAY